MIPLRRRPVVCLALAVLAALVSGAAAGKAVATDHVEAELVAEQAVVVPGQPLTLGLRLRMDEHWHTYWRNPGDTGLPTVLQWQLPAGFAAAEIAWPAPRRIDVGPFANYGYEGEIILPVALTTPSSLSAGADVTLKAHAEWLVCREQCIPGSADVELALPVAAAPAPDTRWSALFAAAKAGLPEPSATPWQAYRTGSRVDIVWSPAAGSALPAHPQFFSYAEGVIEPAARQGLYKLPDGRLRLSLAVAKQLTRTPADIAGVLTSAGARPMEVRAGLAGTLPADAQGGSLQDAPVAFAAGADAGGAGLWGVLVLALFGGMILNLMPCVFPVISLKVLGFAQQAHGHSSVVRRHGLVFGAGVVLSFLALGALVLALRAGGTQLGWGFQLQSTAVVTALAILFFLLALNISGFFEVGALVPGRVATYQPRNPYLNSFFSGVLAVVIASPCTAPFMGAAVGYALAQPGAEALGVFTALGLGMALPYLLLAWFPGWLKRMPRPGPWMVWFKQLLAIPLAATVIWLGWVLAQQAGVDAFARLLFVLLLTAVALWSTRQASLPVPVRRILTAAVVIGAAWIAVPLFDDAQAAGAPATAAGDWEPYSRARIDALDQEGRPVFVDFTAAWCVSCQANKKLVLEREETLRAFAERKVILMRADWTRRDAEITAALAAFGRSGVPVYVLYRPGKPTLVLPEILTAGTLREALQTL